jgi:hypothetical protein
LSPFQKLTPNRTEDAPCALPILQFKSPLLLGQVVSFYSIGDVQVKSWPGLAAVNQAQQQQHHHVGACFLSDNLEHNRAEILGSHAILPS